MQLNEWRLRVLGVPRELKHTLRHTGLMTWEGSHAVARLILALPHLFSGAHPAHMPGAGKDRAGRRAAYKQATRLCAASSYG